VRFGCQYEKYGEEVIVMVKEASSLLWRLSAVIQADSILSNVHRKRNILFSYTFTYLMFIGPCIVLIVE
jgi:hypothetical protein